MKEGKICLIANMSKSLIAVALCLQLPLAVRADELKPETASVDTANASIQDKASSPAEHVTKLLFGSAKKHDDKLDGTGATDALQNPPLDASASDNDAKLQAEKASSDAYKIAAQRLSTGAQLSSDEYRALGVGCAGYEYDRTYFTQIATVSVVYKGSPADEAGIREGDKLVDKEADNEQAREHPTVPQETVTLGQAGTPVHLTVLRHGHPVKLTLLRMNIEDIQQDKYRHQWEQIVHDLGYPKEGTFTGTNLKNLTPGN
jgi:hypothetical protein